MTITVGFINVVKNNFESYLNRDVNQKLYLEKPKIYRFPKVTVCSSMEFNSGKFLRMINFTNVNPRVFNIDRNISNAFKNNFNLTGKELIEKVGWNLADIV